jgi:hypothetical protein
MRAQSQVGKGRAGKGAGVGAEQVGRWVGGGKAGRQGQSAGRAGEGVHAREQVLGQQMLGQSGQAGRCEGGRAGMRGGEQV